MRIVPSQITEKAVVIPYQVRLLDLVKDLQLSTRLKDALTLHTHHDCDTTRLTRSRISLHRMALLAHHKKCDAQQDVVIRTVIDGGNSFEAAAAGAR